jgi:hypothetical protein
MKKVKGRPSTSIGMKLGVHSAFGGGMAERRQAEAIEAR